MNLEEQKFLVEIEKDLKHDEEVFFTQEEIKYAPSEVYRFIDDGDFQGLNQFLRKIGGY